MEHTKLKKQKPDISKTNSSSFSRPYRVRLDLSYDGSHFMGWQRQIAGTYTIQGVLEEKLSQIFKEEIQVQGSGRTDRGVHALMQVAHFDCTRNPTNIRLRKALQSLLPKFLVVRQTYLAPKEFHALRSAENKTYRYLIRNSETPSSQLWNKSVWISKKLDLDYLNQISQYILGRHDFKSFQNAGTELKTTVREIDRAEWSSPKKGWVQFEITGNGFLKQMVRNLVGTMLTLEKAKANPLKLKEILESLDRKKALKTAAPEGLYLIDVKYPQMLDNKCLKF
jgi:tRNA pseudouridine38-40 synthase